MIRSISLALVLSLFIFSSAEANMAAASFNTVIQQSEMGKKAQSILESKIGTEQKNLEKEFAKFQAEAQEFQKQASVLSEKARTQKAQELEGKARGLEAKRNALAQKAGPIQQSLNEAIFAIVQEATENVAKAKDLKIILDRVPPVNFVDKSADVSEDLLKEINKVWKKQGAKFKI